MLLERTPGQVGGDAKERLSYKASRTVPGFLSRRRIPHSARSLSKIHARQSPPRMDTQTGKRKTRPPTFTNHAASAPTTPAAARLRTRRTSPPEDRKTTISPARRQNSLPPWDFEPKIFLTHICRAIGGTGRTGRRGVPRDFCILDIFGGGL